MAHYKRGYARTRGGRKWGSEASWRAKYGFKPVHVPEFDCPHHPRGEWLRQWEAWRRIYWREQKNAHLGSILRGWPRWHDIVFHTRPQRRLTKKLEHQALRDWEDPDDVTWPLGNHKPHKYYW